MNWGSERIDRSPWVIGEDFYSTNFTVTKGTLTEELQQWWSSLTS